ncbi:MAG: IS110 family transposase [Planctomycetota bacterium]|nr:MAG: IS110 family transposase [Planctomycetota bacterium]
MHPAPTTTYAGIDWASRNHAICVVDATGSVLERYEVEHREAGLRSLVRRLTAAHVDGVAIERPDGPVIDALLEADLRVVVIASRHVKALRSRYGLAGNKDDRADAYVLADVLRTDGHRLRPLLPDSDATVALRALVRARKDLVRTRVRLVQQLSAHLELVFPGAVDLFDDLASPIAQAFLARFPSAERAAWLSPKRMAAWSRAQGYCGRRSGKELHTRLVAAPRGRVGEGADAMAAITLAFVRAIGEIRQQADALAGRIGEQLALHPDGHIFTSLPRSGSVRAAALLAEIGDCRERFPTVESLACLAGAAPSTRQSGQHRVVTFRYACDKKLRDALIDFAGDSRHASPWAADIYRRARAGGKRHPHAVRILARAWLGVIWRCWQDHTAYDPNRHRALQRVLLAPAA